MKEKQYEVEIYEKHSHGVWGKQHYFGWVLSSNNKANAESFALDILAGMTPNEICTESGGKLGFDTSYGWWGREYLDDGSFRYVKLDHDKPIGYEEAEKRFTIKASVFKG